MSAYSRKRRPGYERLLEGIASGDFEALAIWHPDRLTRHPGELEGFIDCVEQADLQIATATAGDWDLSTPDGRLMARIVGSVSRKESEDKSRRLKRKHLELAQAGKVSGGGRRPFGYEQDKLTVRESEAVEIRSAVGRVIAGESLRSITHDWTARGVASVTGAHWQGTTVRRLLCSARIAGQRDHQGVLSAAEWPGIITFEEMVRVRAQLNKAAATPGRTPRKYLLTGLIVCGRCAAEGRSVKLTSGPVRRKGILYGRYLCSVDKGGCGRVGISGARLDELVAEALFEVLDSPEAAKALAKPARSKKNALRPLERLEERRAELAEMFAAGEINRSEWATARDSIEAQHATQTAAVTVDSTAAAQTALAGTGRTLRARWEDLPLGKRRAIVEVVLESIQIAPTQKSNNKFDPSRVSISWRI